MIKLLIFTFCLIQLARSESNIYCSKGPSYWCQSVQNANECNAFKHCLESVWSKHKTYTQSNVGDSFLSNTNTPNKCVNCVQCYLNNYQECPYLNQFKKEIGQMILERITPVSACKLLTQCDENGEDVQLEKLIEDPIMELKTDKRFDCGLHPRNWCDNIQTAVKCNVFDQCLNKNWLLSPIDNSLVKAEPNTISEKTCSFCVYAFDKLKDILSDKQNPVEIKIKDYLISACGILPSKEASQKCQQTVNAYYDEISTLISKDMDSRKICKLMNACNEKFLEPKNVVENSQNLLEGEQIANLLKQMKIRVLNEKEIQVKTPLQDSKFKVDQLQKTMGVGCELCTIVFNAAKFLVENKVPEDKVFKFIEKELCSRLGQYNQTCVAYVETEGPMIISLLEKSVDSGIICRSMGLCLRVQVSDDEYKNKKYYDLDVRNDLNCTLCKMVFIQVKQMLSSQQSEQKILDYINNNLCSHVGKSKETCKSLIDAYGPTLLKMVAQDIHPDQLCTMIGMCKATDNEIQQVEIVEDVLIPSNEQFKVEADPKCILCEFVMSVVEKYLQKNATEPEIEKVLQKVCQNFPTALRNECSSFINQYGPVIIQLLINDVDSNKICAFINLCPSQESKQINRPQPEVYNKFKDQEHLFKLRSKVWINHQREFQEKQQKQQSIKMVDLKKTKILKNNELMNDEHVKGSNQTVQCSLCIYAAELIDKALDQNKTEDQIVKEVELVCNLFPGDLKNQCTAFINEYGPYVIKLIAADVDPLQACIALRLCNKTNSVEARRQILLN